MDMMLVLLIIGIFSGFFIQTISGFAGALVALPFLLFVMPIAEAVTYISIFYFLSTPIYFYKEWKNMDKDLLKKLAITSFIGILIGSVVLLYGQPQILKKALGLFIVLFVLNSLINKNEKQLGFKMKSLFGILGGFFSGVFSTGGPLYVMVIKNETADIKTFRATMFGILGLVSVMRISVLVFEGVLTTTELYNSMYVLPFFIVALVLGKIVYSKLNEEFLKKFILALLFVSGAVLLFKN
ncbi:putative membrane protein YfcA [Flavobacterium sp. CG_23.5]|uniref:sulfite exporter TauE/SafE family protein n=1 Tax=unclassified Flavobacterium TaxID=196869 RepID=UPI0018CB8BF8|nr:MULTISPECIES: sulfite exporter TauE/SafE family protein [unclassified Flavobacterium]MBG6111351.1 putative membrane protein YfcA [Flavobacterium sp. CG_9.10]MBP2282139.1 putative membrane protein YfcA [Flavobacterium sp. CG_23.5]